MTAPRRKVADRYHHNGETYVNESSSSLSNINCSEQCTSDAVAGIRSTTPISKFNLAKKLMWLLLPPALLTVGLTTFTQSFFLSRTSFDHRSSCNVGSAGTLLQGALGLNNDEIQFLRKYGFLSDNDGNNGIDNKKKSSSHDDAGYGCWVPKQVDSMAILVVDALRFDFARDHLPLSIGSRLFPVHHQNNHNDTTSTSALRKNKDLGTSKLYQFVADPPTVTMQRLKGLTTGGLPTFADISGSFGGASIDEDSWVEQLKDVPWDRRKKKKASLLLDTTEKNERSKKPQIAFVGDDTWVDLFPSQFDDCHPFPSFNTRDLDTVDNGCLEHLPRLLDGLVGLNNNNNMNKQQSSSSSPSFELIVSHFLGVDHVGHTYGPNNPHMESKLHQMDVMLSNTLNIIDNAPRESCIVALVLGDHGMTEDGNHGGGTSDEVNAGLFVHFSPGCNNNDDVEKEKVTGEDIPGSAHAFDSIHQIDLVPTISFLLGLPIPYANIGGLVPNLLPTPSDTSNNTQSTAATTTSIQHMAVALALNAAQVWNYLDTYSRTSRDLPSDRLKELKELLDSATLVYRDAIAHSQRHINDNDIVDKQQFFDATAYRQACGLYKLFLAESTGLGKQVWTQFNEGGMNIGIGILVMAWIMAMPLWKGRARKEIWAILCGSRARAEINGSVKENYNVTSKNLTKVQPSYRRLELLTAILFMVFQCGVLTFSNSYIEHEREIVTFFLCVICLLVFRRWCYSGLDTQTTLNVGGHGASLYLPLVVALCSRINDIFVTGHGLDPSIRLHAAYHPIVFLSSLTILGTLRLAWVRPMTKYDDTANRISVCTDLVALICLAGTWLEKRSLDHSRNGFTLARLSMLSIAIGLAHSASCLTKRTESVERSKIEHVQLALFRSMLFVVVVTGPSTASSAVLVLIQCAALRLMQSTGTREVPAPVMAAIWRLAIRHVFFGTNHHCSFNRLQFSAAFVATETFQFFIAGSSLFMNTFGWEILGSMLVLANTRASFSANKAFRDGIWDWFRFFQLTEMLASCVSVSAMKRHLMVWAIFAPRFMFAAIFTAVSVLFWVLDIIITVPSSMATRDHSKQSSS